MSRLQTLAVLYMRGISAGTGRRTSDWMHATHPISSVMIRKRNDAYSFSIQKWISTVADEKNGENDINKDKMVASVVGCSHKYTLPRWLRWLCGSTLLLVPPSWNRKSDCLSKLEGKVEKITETVENVADVVEGVATVAEKISAEVAEKLPEHGTLQNGALIVERVSKEAIKDAHITKDIIQKVDELKQEIVEKVVERVTDLGKLPDKEDERE